MIIRPRSSAISAIRNTTVAQMNEAVWETTYKRTMVGLEPLARRNSTSDLMAGSCLQFAQQFYVTPLWSVCVHFQCCSFVCD